MSTKGKSVKNRSNQPQSQKQSRTEQQFRQQTKNGPYLQNVRQTQNTQTAQNVSKTQNTQTAQNVSNIQNRRAPSQNLSRQVRAANTSILTKFKNAAKNAASVARNKLSSTQPTESPQNIPPSNSPPLNRDISNISYPISDTYPNISQNPYPVIPSQPTIEELKGKISSLEANLIKNSEIENKNLQNELKIVKEKLENIQSQQKEELKSINKIKTNQEKDEEVHKAEEIEKILSLKKNGGGRYRKITDLPVLDVKLQETPPPSPLESTKTKSDIPPVINPPPTNPVSENISELPKDIPQIPKDIPQIPKDIPQIPNPSTEKEIDLKNGIYKLSRDNLELVPDKFIDNELVKLKNKRLVSLEKIAKKNNYFILNKVTNDKYYVNKKNRKLIRQKFTYYTPVNDRFIDLLLKEKLQHRVEEPEPLYQAKIDNTTNDLTIIEEKIISENSYEIAEAGKLLKWIETNLVLVGNTNSVYFEYFLFADLVYFYYKGYIYLSKAGVKYHNHVTEKNANLKYLKKYIGKKIDDTEIMEDVKNAVGKTSNNETLDECLKLLSLKYFICLQPEPKYLLSILETLVTAWYTDFDLITGISKIRILINQYRCRRDKKENIKLGVLSSILVYINYGLKNFGKVLSKINYYFTNLVHTGWKGNYPDHFYKYNDLIYYCCGSPDTKRYLESIDGIKKESIYENYGEYKSAFIKYGINVVSPKPIPNPYVEQEEYRSIFNREEINKKLMPIVIDPYIKK